jgi:hypothetical protein
MSTLKQDIEDIQLGIAIDSTNANLPKRLEIAKDATTQILASIRKHLPEKVDMEKFEGVSEDGGIGTTIYDNEEDPSGNKNGEMLAHLCQFADDTGYNQAIDEITKLLEEDK